MGSASGHSPDRVREDVLTWLTSAWDPSLSLSQWWDRLAASGWAAPSWPERACGRALPRWSVGVVREEFGQRGVPGPPGGPAYTMAIPTLIDLGTEAQCNSHAAAVLRGEERWCQLFSEPDAGSDLASLRTKAVRDGDEWVITGQKVWSSHAVEADYGMLLARTDEQVPKHSGISWFIVPMAQRGVEIRPLRQMNGNEEFNEVFLSDVRVPASGLVGEVNDGWRVTLTTLAHERTNLTTPTHAVVVPRHLVAELRAGDVAPRFGRGSNGHAVRGPRWLISLAREQGRAHDPMIRQRLAQLYIQNEIRRYTGMRIKAERGSGPHPAGSTQKMAASKTIRESANLAAEIVGAAGMLAPPDAPRDGAVYAMVLWAPAVSIAAGTDEIQRNIVAERVLGLPKDPAPDRAGTQDSRG